MVSISQITKELRIPELKYEISNHQETEEVITSIVLFLDQCARDERLLNGQATLIKTLAEQGEHFRLSPRIYNSLFLCDRLTDVFTRKANLDDHLKNILSGWRFVLAKIFVQFPDLLASADSSILTLIDEISASQIGWSPEPKRVSQVVVDRLQGAHQSLLSLNTGSSEAVDAISAQWRKDEDTQRERIAKLFQRLEATEQGAATSRYTTEYSFFLLNKLLKGVALPASIYEFLVDRWQPVLRSVLLAATQDKESADNEWKDTVKLTERLVFVFASSNRNNNSALFRQAEGLVDELAALANRHNIEIDNDEWESIQQLLIMVLQNTDIERITVPIKESSINFSADVNLSHDECLNLINEWYLVKHDENNTRLKFSRYFEDSREILWLNHAGMKSMLMPYEAFKKGQNTGTISKIKPCYLVSQVFSETLRGLGKVAQAQYEAREKAKQKAAAEAEQLRLEKQQAEEAKRLQEQEAARLLKEQRFKAAEKERLEKEQVVLKLIDDMSLGAWISVMEASAKEKYKLVVKINATDKLIFVDKMGLKKFEIKTPELMTRILGGDIEILSGGAEFDDTLSRVVGRLRVGK